MACPEKGFTMIFCFNDFALAYLLEYGLAGGGQGLEMMLSFFLLRVVLEHFLEALACEEDAALDCSEGKIHLLGDLGVLVTLNVHRERNLVVVGEGVDCSGDFFSCDRTFGSFKT